MLVSFNWLKEYLDLSEISPEELAEKFTLGGLEVEMILEPGKNLHNIVVGKVLTCDPVEGSEHLKMTTVDVGDEILPIVCGAPNVAADQKVIVAKIGAVLPGDFEIKETKIMGELSKGMICSLDELGFSESVVPKAIEDGIYVFNDDAKIGDAVHSYIGLDDAIFEFDLTPNRADALSMRGIAHEVAALLDQTLTFEEVVVNENPDKHIDDYLSVEVESVQDTEAYKMRIVENVTVNQSPQWMQTKLMNAGMRPIDLVVDVTNYVMLEYGQPLHAFDYDQLGSKEIYVRRAKDGEKITTLDDQNHELNTDNLVITNGKEPVALAGVMGGANSQITNSTKTIAIESAIFDPVLTRRTANRLNLRSEASSRFEKGVNKATVQEAADFAAKLIAELGDGTVVSGTAAITDKKIKDVIIETNLKKVNGLLGTTMTSEEVSSILTRLGFDHEILQENQIKAYIPSRRWDIKIAEDLIEEIARIYGYNNIPITLPVTESIPGELTSEQRITRSLRHNLESNGLHESISYSLTTLEKATKYAIQAGETVSLKNPASKDRVTLRQNIISGLLDDAAYNRAHQNTDIALYEIGRLFYKNKEDNYDEYTHVGGLLSGHSQKDWLDTDDQLDFYVVKGLVENLLSSYLFSEEISYSLNETRQGMHPGRTADVYLGEKVIGYLGQIHPTVSDKFDLEDTYVFELSLDEIVHAKKETLQYTPLSRYPGSTRDIALLVDKQVSHSEIVDVIKNAGGQWIHNIDLFDLYAGKNIDKNKKSMAYSLYFENPNRTLKEDEVKKDFEQIKESLKERLKVEIR